MGEENVVPKDQSGRVVSTIVIGVLAFVGLAGLFAVIIVVAGEIPWHHVFSCTCG